MTKSGSGDAKNVLYCSFCGKSQHEVRKANRWARLYSSVMSVSSLCMDIIREEHKTNLVKSRRWCAYTNADILRGA